MYYIEKDDRIVLFDESKGKLVDTLKFMPQYHDLEIKETNRPIVDFEFADTQEYQERKAKEEREERMAIIKKELEELDTKRIRAVCENEIKDEQTGQTWLEYYNERVRDLRSQLI